MNSNVLTIGMVVGAIAAIVPSVNAQSIIADPLLLAQSDPQGCIYQERGGYRSKICYKPQFNGIRIDSCLLAYASNCKTHAVAEKFCSLQTDGYTRQPSKSGNYAVGDRPAQTISIINGEVYNRKNYPLTSFQWIRCYPQDTVANNKPKKEDFDSNKQPNWCTNSFEQVPIGDGKARKYVNFSSACRQHDLCFWTIDSVKTQCDNQFLKNLKDICTQEIKSSLRGQCNLNANLYYKAVSDDGIIEKVTKRPSKGFKAAQGEAREVANQLQRKFPNLDTARYYKDIASQLANRQARGESVQESINNAVNAISGKVSNER